MLRVGLTGDLGSGKSTVARMLGEHGAVVMESDGIARALMEPGRPVYRAIVERFGRAVLLTDGLLNREELARIAFDPQHPRVEELNALVHPAVLAEQEHRIAVLREKQPESIVVVESALVFSARTHGDDAAVAEQEPWWRRFDCIVVVTAPHAAKITRYMERLGQGGASAEQQKRLRNDAERRLRVQAETAVPVSDAILTLENAGSKEELVPCVKALWKELQWRAAAG